MCISTDVEFDVFVHKSKSVLKYNEQIYLYVQTLIEPSKHIAPRSHCKYDRNEERAAVCYWRCLVLFSLLFYETKTDVSQRSGH